MRRTYDDVPPTDPLWTTSIVYIYLNGERIASQWGADRTTNKFVGWNSHNPVIGSDADKVFDPTGAEVGLTAPLPPPDPPPPDPPIYASIIDFDGGCYLDGVRTPCSIALGLVNSGAADHAPLDPFRSVYNPVTGQNELARYHVDWVNGFYGFVPLGATYGGDGTWSWNPSRRLEARRGRGLGEDGEGDGVLSPLTPAAAPAAAKTGFGLVIDHRRDITLSHCYTMVDGKVVSDEVIGVDWDRTSAIIGYSAVPLGGNPGKNTVPMLGLYGKDERGHIIGKALGGIGDPRNLFSINKDFNNSFFKSIEYSIRRELTNHQDWEAHIIVDLKYERAECDSPRDEARYFRPNEVEYVVRFFRNGRLVSDFKRVANNPR